MYQNAHQKDAKGGEDPRYHGGGSREREAVIHLPARPASQTHKYPKRRTNSVLDASIWTQKKLELRS